MDNRYAALLVIALFLLSFALIYSVKSLSVFSLGENEIDHLTISKEIHETQSLVFYNPYNLPEEEVEFFHSHLEMGHDILLASIINLTGAGILDVPLVACVFLAFLMSLGAFALMNRFSGSNLLSLLGALFVLMFTATPLISGYLFAVPLLSGMVLAPLLVLCFIEGMHSNRFFLLFILFSMATFFFHPVFIVYFVPVIALFLVLNLDLLVENAKRLFFLVGAVLVVVAGFMSWRLNLQIFPKFLKEIVFQGQANLQETTLSAVLPWPILALTFLGVALMFLLAVLKKPVLGFKRIKLKAAEGIEFKPLYGIFLVLFVLVWMWIQAFSDTNMLCLFGPCARTAAGFTLFFLITASFGLYCVLHFAVRRISGLRGQAGKYANYAVLLAVVAVLFLMLSTLPFVFMQGIKQSFFESHYLGAFEWIGSNRGNAIVLADPFISQHIHVVSGNKVVAATSARLGNLENPFVVFDASFDPFQQDDLAQETGFFGLRSCLEQKHILQKYSAQIAFASNHIECPGLNKILDSAGGAIYELIEN